MSFTYYKKYDTLKSEGEINSRSTVGKNGINGRSRITQSVIKRKITNPAEEVDINFSFTPTHPSKKLTKEITKISSKRRKRNSEVSSNSLGSEICDESLNDLGREKVFGKKESIPIKRGSSAQEHDSGDEIDEPPVNSKNILKSYRKSFGIDQQRSQSNKQHNPTTNDISRGFGSEVSSRSSRLNYNTSDVNSTLEPNIPQSKVRGSLKRASQNDSEHLMKQSKINSKKIDQIPMEEYSESPSPKKIKKNTSPKAKLRQKQSENTPPNVTEEKNVERSKHASSKPLNSSKRVNLEVNPISYWYFVDPNRWKLILKTSSKGQESMVTLTLKEVNEQFMEKVKERFRPKDVIEVNPQNEKLIILEKKYEHILKLLEIEKKRIEEAEKFINNYSLTSQINVNDTGKVNSSNLSTKNNDSNLPISGMEEFDPSQLLTEEEKDLLKYIPNNDIVSNITSLASFSTLQAKISSLELTIKKLGLKNNQIEYRTAQISSKMRSLKIPKASLKSIFE